MTGAAIGIGRAIADRLSAAGFPVVVADIDVNGGETAAAQIASTGRPCVFVECDVTSEPSVEKALNDARNAYGDVGVLVNNAGVDTYFDATTMAEVEWEQAMAVDLKGLWFTSKYTIPQMLARGEGSIVNISSIMAFQTMKGRFPYSAAKAGVIGLTKSLAVDYGSEGIRVNAVCPGWTRTRLVETWFAMQEDPHAAEQRVIDTHPLGRIATPGDIANLVAFLASDESSFITGTHILIDGGVSARLPLA